MNACSINQNFNNSNLNNKFNANKINSVKNIDNNFINSQNISEEIFVTFELANIKPSSKNVFSNGLFQKAFNFISDDKNRNNIPNDLIIGAHLNDTLEKVIIDFVEQLSYNSNIINLDGIPAFNLFTTSPLSKDDLQKTLRQLFNELNIGGDWYLYVDFSEGQKDYISNYIPKLRDYCNINLQPNLEYNKEYRSNDDCCIF